MVKALDGRNHGNGDIFKQVAERMEEAGYVCLSKQVRRF